MLRARLDLSPDELDAILTPALAIQLDTVRRNLAKLCDSVSDISRLRPHIKSAKLAAVFREMIDVGLKHFKCATTREAQVMLDELDAAGVAGDLLVAYPHVGANLRRVEQIARDHPRSKVSVLRESPEELPEALDIYVDVNAGMNRTGIPLGETERILEVAHAAGDRFAGIHFYEGHVHSGSFEDRCAQSHPLYDDLLELIARAQREGFPVREVVTSGTPSFMPALAHEGLRDLRNRGVHRLSPGTLVYFDARSAECEELDYEAAAFVLTRVVSHPRAGSITVDAGSKAIAAEAGSPVAVVPSWPGLQARTPSEEHLPFDVASGDTPARGEILALVPRHVCPTVNLAEEALLLDADHVRTTPVTARAHELRP